MSATEFQPRHRDEPVSMGEALSGAFGATDLETYIAQHEAEERANPDNTNKLGICKVCKAVLPSKVIPMGRFGFLPNVCCDSCADKGKDDLERKKQEELDKKFAGMIPAEFIAWDPAKGNGPLQARVNGAFSYTSRKGIVIHGQSGRCKTRILWQLVKGVASQPEGFSWSFLDAFEVATKGLPAEAERADFLFIDDLGNEPTGTKWETSFLHLVRKRCDWHRPIFVTTQLTGAQFKQRYFNGSAAAAILRRFSERCVMISADDFAK